MNGTSGKDASVFSKSWVAGSETPYLQPPVTDTRFLPMRLMFRPALGQELPAGAATEKLIRAIYFEKYHAINKIPSSTLDRLLGSSHDTLNRNGVPFSAAAASTRGGRR